MNSCPHCGRRGTGYKNEPTGYVAWHEWAERMSKTHKQVKCICGRYTIWVKK